MANLSGRLKNCENEISYYVNRAQFHAEDLTPHEAQKRVMSAYIGAMAGVSIAGTATALSEKPLNPKVLVCAAGAGAAAGIYVFDTWDTSYLQFTRTLTSQERESLQSLILEKGRWSPEDLCPFTGQPPLHPVKIGERNQVYEKAALEQWQRGGIRALPFTSPFSRVPGDFFREDDLVAVEHRKPSTLEDICPFTCRPPFYPVQIGRRSQLYERLELLRWLKDESIHTSVTWDPLTGEKFSEDEITNSISNFEKVIDLCHSLLSDPNEIDELTPTQQDGLKILKKDYRERIVAMYEKECEDILRCRELYDLIWECRGEKLKFLQEKYYEAEYERKYRPITRKRLSILAEMAELINRLDPMRASKIDLLFVSVMNVHFFRTADKETLLNELNSHKITHRQMLANLFEIEEENLKEQHRIWGPLKKTSYEDDLKNLREETQRRKEYSTPMNIPRKYASYIGGTAAVQETFFKELHNLKSDVLDDQAKQEVRERLHRLYETDRASHCKKGLSRFDRSFDQKLKEEIKGGFFERKALFLGHRYRVFKEEIMQFSRKV